MDFSIPRLACADRFASSSIAVRHAERSISYGEFEQASSRVANGLRAQGVTAGDRVAAISLSNNLLLLASMGYIDAGLDFHSASGSWVFSIYGKNLLDEVSFGNDTQLPATFGGLPLGGTFAPVMPGVRYGVEITYNLL